MRKAHVGAQQFIWIMIVTLAIFVVGLNQGKKNNPEVGSPEGGIERRNPSSKNPIPIYPGAFHVMSIGDKMYMDGLPMQIKSFETYDSLDKVIAYYKEFWTREGLEPYDSDASETYKVCGVVDKGRNSFMTITALDRQGKTLVFPSYSQLSDISKPKTFEDVPINPENLDRYVIDFNDYGQTGAQNDISLNKMDLQGNYDWYRKNMKSKGWNLVHKEVKPREGLLFMFFQKKQRNITISFHYDEKAGHTAVMMNIQN